MTRTLKIAVSLLELFAGIAGSCVHAIIAPHTKLSDREVILIVVCFIIFWILYWTELLFLPLIKKAIVGSKEADMSTEGDRLRLLFLLFSVLVFYDLHGGVNFIPDPYQKLPFLIKATFGVASLCIYFLIKVTKLNNLLLHARKTLKL